MYVINKIALIPKSPFRQSVEIALMELCEKIVPFPIMYLDYVRLPEKNGKLRFLIKYAYGTKDK